MAAATNYHKVGGLNNNFGGQKSDIGFKFHCIIKSRYRLGLFLLEALRGESVSSPFSSFYWLPAFLALWSLPESSKHFTLIFAHIATLAFPSDFLSPLSGLLSFHWAHPDILV